MTIKIIIIFIIVVPAVKHKFPYKNVCQCNTIIGAKILAEDQ